MKIDVPKNKSTISQIEDDHPALLLVDNLLTVVESKLKQHGLSCSHDDLFYHKKSLPEDWHNTKLYKDIEIALAILREADYLKYLIIEGHVDDVCYETVRLMQNLVLFDQNFIIDLDISKVLSNHGHAAKIAKLDQLYSDAMDWCDNYLKSHKTTKTCDAARKCTEEFKEKGFKVSIRRLNEKLREKYPERAARRR